MVPEVSGVRQDVAHITTAVYGVRPMARGVVKWLQGRAVQSSSEEGKRQFEAIMCNVSLSDLLTVVSVHQRDFRRVERSDEKKNNLFAHDVESQQDMESCARFLNILCSFFKPLSERIDTILVFPFRQRFIRTLLQHITSDQN